MIDVKNKSHNKKRNSLVVHDLLASKSAERLVAGDSVGSSHAVDIARRHFGRGSELYKEFRLMSALVLSTVSSREIAANVLRESRLAALRHDVERLEREKASLIAEINRSFNDSEFFDRRVRDYKLYATVQTLVNDWRRPSEESALRVATYEEDVIKRLLEQKDSVLSADEFPAADDSIIRLMTKKLSERYSWRLVPEQRRILKLYSAVNNVASHVELVKLMKDIRERIVAASTSSAVEILDESVRRKLDVLAVDVASDDSDVVPASIVKHMLYAALIAELDAKEERAR